MTSISQFGALVLEKRKAQGLSQDELSQRTGIQGSALSLVERGKIGATLQVAIQLATELSLGLGQVAECYGITTVPIYQPYLEHEVSSVNQLPVDIGIGQIGSVLSGLGPTVGNPPLDLLGVTAQELQFFIAVDKAIPLIPGMSAPRIWRAVETGRAVTMRDGGYLVADLRRQGRLSMKNVEQVAKVADSYISKLEAGGFRRLRLGDIAKLDSGLAQEGRVFAAYWAGGLFESWCRGANVFGASAKPPEMAGITTRWLYGVVRLSRLMGIVNTLSDEARASLWRILSPDLSELDPGISRFDYAPSKRHRSTKSAMLLASRA